MVRAFKATEVVSTPEGDYTLAIDIAIIDELEDAFDLGFAQLMEQFQGQQRVGRVARLLRGLLARHHPNLTLDDVGGLVMGHAEAFGSGMERLFTKAQPEKGQGQEAKGENPPKPHRGTGGNSSSRGARPASRRATSGSKRLAHSS